MHDIRVIDRDGEYASGSLSVQIEKKPGALIFKQAETLALNASICGDCGYAELYAADPNRLWEAYVTSRQLGAT
jgi:formate dehydrogenase assembly factor FdhD